MDVAAHFPASPSATAALARASERAWRRAQAGQGWGRGDDGRRDVPLQVRARSHHGGGDAGAHRGRWQGGVSE